MKKTSNCARCGDFLIHQECDFCEVCKKLHSKMSGKRKKVVYAVITLTLLYLIPAAPSLFMERRFAFLYLIGPYPDISKPYNPPILYTAVAITLFIIVTLISWLFSLMKSNNAGVKLTLFLTHALGVFLWYLFGLGKITF